MELEDPVSVYNAKSDAEAQMLGQMLNEAGIDAKILEDHSVAGLFADGAVAHLPSPQVVVARADAERTAEILLQFDQARQQLQSQARANAELTFVTAVCEECGQSSTFTGTLVGSVQDCPHCGKFMDVGAGDEDFDPGNPEDEDAEKEEE